MNFVVITGMSGSGKTHALHILEDMGFYCVDNIPVNLLRSLVDKLDYENVAAVCDIRTGDMNTLPDTVKAIGGKIIFLDTDEGTIIKRYKETRRCHPLDKGEGLVSAIENERDVLRTIRESAVRVIDTTYLSLGELRGEIMDTLEICEEQSEFEISVVSFGFKNGTPKDADMLFDVRCFPNPFYVEELKNKTGNDKAVQDFVMAHESAREYLVKIVDMISFIVPVFKKEGRYSLAVAIGCTGGHHRSVTFANLLAETLKDYGMMVNIVHRDISQK